MPDPGVRAAEIPSGQGAGSAARAAAGPSRSQPGMVKRPIQASLKGSEQEPTAESRFTCSYSILGTHAHGLHHVPMVQQEPCARFAPASAMPRRVRERRALTAGIPRGWHRGHWCSPPLRRRLAASASATASSTALPRPAVRMPRDLFRRLHGAPGWTAQRVADGKSSASTHTLPARYPDVTPG